MIYNNAVYLSQKILMGLTSFFLLLNILSSCQKENVSAKSAIPVKTLTGPINEIKCYQLFAGYSINDQFEASGLYVQGDYFYVVFDNRYKIGKVLNTLTPASASNTLIGSNTSGESNYEGITYNSNNQAFYVVTEAAQNGNSYYPEITQYNNSFTVSSSLWTDYAFFPSESNKAFEGIAYIRRNNTDYMLCVVEGTGKIAVMQLTGSTWTKQTEFSIPVTFSDYSEIVLYGNRIAVMSQQDSRFWLGTLSSTTWNVTSDTGTIYTFPTGNSNGVVGAGTNNIYAFEEGLSFIDDSTIATCSDHAGSSDPSYKKYKDQSIQVFRLR